MINRLLFIVLMLVAVQFAVAQQPPSPMVSRENPAAAIQPGELQISGRLVDAVTGQFINHARVAIAPVTQRDAFTTVITAEDGRFSFGNIAPGKYTLTAQARGYLTQSFNQHDQYSSSIVVGPELKSTGLTFRLAPAASISGTITDEGGEPVREAGVALYLLGVSGGVDATRVRAYVQTDDQGSYRFGHLAPGKYLVAVSARPWYAEHGRMAPPPIITRNGGGGTIGAVPGASYGLIGGNVSSGGGAQAEEQRSPLDVAYPITFYPGVTDAESAGVMTLGPGDKATADVSLQPVPALHIRLADSHSGQRSYVTLQKPVLDGRPMQVLTETRESNGIVELVGVPAGHYSMATMPNAALPDARVTEDVDLLDSGKIDLHQGTASATLTATIQGEGLAAAETSLILTNKKTHRPQAEQIPATGQVDFKQGLSAGSYEVSLSSPQRRLYIKTISATGAKVFGRTLEIRGASPVKLRVAVSEGEGEVKGTALRDGNPFAGAMIVLVPDDPAHNLVLFRRDQSDSDGTFTLSNVVPGKYTLLALEKGWDMEWTNPEVLKPYLPQGDAVQVEPRGKYNLKPPVQ